MSKGKEKVYDRENHRRDKEKVRDLKRSREEDTQKEISRDSENEKEKDKDRSRVKKRASKKRREDDDETHKAAEKYEHCENKGFNEGGGMFLFLVLSPLILTLQRK